jgi:dGTPase
VATIAREIAENIARRAATDDVIAQVILDLGGLDITACEAAGLAHDLGHPPFGHAGEHQLDHELRNTATAKRLPELEEGFEGNAQSFRIVTLLDGQKLGRRGLDLTNVVLAAIQKYPYARKPKLSKFGAYGSEAKTLEQCRAAVIGDDWKTNETQSLEASIMDLADDIAYAVHDLEDFVGAGVIDLREPIDAMTDAIEVIGGSPKERYNPFLDARDELKKKSTAQFNDQTFLAALRWAERLFKNELPPIVGVATPTDAISLREALSNVIAMLFQGIVVTADRPTRTSPYVTLEDAAWHRLQVLKATTRRYLVMTPRMGIIQRAQTKAITTLYEGLTTWLAEAPDPSTIPPELKHYITRAGGKLPTKDDHEEVHLVAGHYRGVVDYICGMSDSEALLRSQWISGVEVPGMSTLGVPL